MQINHKKRRYLRTTLRQVRSVLVLLWRIIRQLSGDDAYERYLQQHAAHHHACDHPPLTRQAYFKQRQDQQWQGIKRCC